MSGAAKPPRDRALEPLFTPFQLGSLRLENRFVMAPMTRWHSPGQVPGADVAGYYRRRAEAGVGLIITEGTTIDHPVSSYSERVPAFHGKAALAGWRRVVEEVHDAGGKIIPQIWHVGAMRSPGQDFPNPELPAVSPSGRFKPGGKVANPPMTQAQIDAVVAAFAAAASQARELGFDGVEVHGAHGYLLDQFMWDALNSREDSYGGDAIARTRFAVEVVAAMRAAVGPDFPLVFRFSQWKQQDYSARLAQTPDELAALLAPLKAAGVDMFHCSQRRYWEPEFEHSGLNIAGWVRKVTGTPTITVGSVGLAGALSTRNLGETAGTSTDLEPLARGVAQGDFDLVAVGRALLVDPRWVEKVRDGRLDQLIPFNEAALATLS